MRGESLLDSFAFRRVFRGFLLQQLARLDQSDVELLLQTLCVLFALAARGTENEDSFHYFQIQLVVWFLLTKLVD